MDALSTTAISSKAGTAGLLDLLVASQDEFSEGVAPFEAAVGIGGGGQPVGSINPELERPGRHPAQNVPGTLEEFLACVRVMVERRAGQEERSPLAEDHGVHRGGRPARAAADTQHPPQQ